MSRSTYRSPSGLIDGFFRQVPKDLAEAAQIDGCTRWEAFLAGRVPAPGPGIARRAYFAVSDLMNEFPRGFAADALRRLEDIAGRAAGL